MITNKEKYLEVYDNIAGEWNIKKIIEKVKILNDNYFPKPISSKKMDIKCQIKCLELGIEKDKITDDIFNIDNGALTEYEVKKAYYKLSNYLHSKNPFAKEIKYEKIMSYIIEITNKTIKLLNRHQIFLYDKNYFFYVFMKDAETGNVGGNIFEKLELKKS